jgi:hypothetical protein
MMNTIFCDDPTVPTDEQVQPADVNVYIHPSGMLATHNYSCPVCQENHAVYNMGTGIMKPCWGCQSKGYHIVKVEKSWWSRILFNMLTGKELR